MALPLFIKQKQTGISFLNELKRFVRPYWLVPQNTDNLQGQIAVLANGTGNFVLSPDQNGPFEGFYFTSEHGGDMLVRINDGGSRRNLMNRDVHMDTIMTPVPGGQRPFLLPEGLWIQQRRSLAFTFTDISGVAQTVRPVLHGRKFFLKQAKPGLAAKFVARRDMIQAVTTPYFYTTDNAVNLPLVNTTSQPANITISDEGHFVAHKITCVSDGPFDFIIRDGRTGQSLSGAIRISNTSATGTSRFPYVFPEPWFIERSSQIIIEFTNRFAGGANNIFMTWSGRRVYDEQYGGIL